MYKFEENKNGVFTPAEIDLIGGIFAHARNDYEVGWKKIQKAGGLEYLKSEYSEAVHILNKYDKRCKVIKKRITDARNYNKTHVDKKEIEKIPPYNEKELKAKKIINHYLETTELANSVEAFISSKWFDNLSTMAGLDPNFMKTQFHKIRDEIINSYSC